MIYGCFILDECLYIFFLSNHIVSLFINNYGSKLNLKEKVKYNTYKFVLFLLLCFAINNDIVEIIEVNYYFHSFLINKS